MLPDLRHTVVLEPPSATFSKHPDCLYASLLPNFQFVWRITTKWHLDELSRRTQHVLLLLKIHTRQSTYGISMYCVMALWGCFTEFILLSVCVSTAAAENFTLASFSSCCSSLLLATSEKTHQIGHYLVYSVFSNLKREQTARLTDWLAPLEENWWKNNSFSNPRTNWLAIKLIRNKLVQLQSPPFAFAFSDSGTMAAWLEQGCQIVLESRLNKKEKMFFNFVTISVTKSQQIIQSPTIVHFTRRFWLWKFAHIFRE